MINKDLKFRAKEFLDANVWTIGGERYKAESYRLFTNIELKEFVYDLLDEVAAKTKNTNNGFRHKLSDFDTENVHNLLGRISNHIRLGISSPSLEMKKQFFRATQAINQARHELDVFNDYKYRDKKESVPCRKLLLKREEEDTTDQQIEVLMKELNQ